MQEPSAQVAADRFFPPCNDATHLKSAVTEEGNESWTKWIYWMKETVISLLDDLKTTSNWLMVLILSTVVFAFRHGEDLKFLDVSLPRYDAGMVLCGLCSARVPTHASHIGVDG